MHDAVIHAEKRTVFGKPVRRYISQGKVPAVLYGLGEPSAHLFIDHRELLTLYRSGGLHSLIDLTMNDEETHKALIVDVQVHPVTSRVLHVDFKRVDMQQKVKSEAELNFIGESLAVKNLGGTLTILLHSVPIECLPDDLVSHIDVDISRLATFDDRILFKDIVSPRGVAMCAPSDHIVAVVAPPRSEDELKQLDEAVVEDVSHIERIEKPKKEEDAQEGVGEGK